MAATARSRWKVPAKGPAFTADDRAILDQVPGALAGGVELYRWWLRTHRTMGYSRRIPLDRQLHSPGDFNFGFLEDVPLRRGIQPVLGIFQEQFYDWPKAPPGGRRMAAEEVRDQAREYKLRYFLRLSSRVRVQSEPQGPEEAPPEWLRGLSLCGGGKPLRTGWRYNQVYYKLRGEDEPRKFAAADRHRIVDLRSVGDLFEWIVFRIQIFGFEFTLHLAGTDGPKLTVPVKEEVHTVLSRDFLVDEEAEASGAAGGAAAATRLGERVLGRYGYGYAVVPDPNVKSILAYGPTGLTTTFETFELRVLESGKMLANSAFVANQPTRLVDVDPVEWGFELADAVSFGTASRLLSPVKRALSAAVPEIDPVFQGVQLANLLTGGYAADALCISREEILRGIMALHFLETYNFLLGTISTWKLVPDWGAAEQHDWVRQAEA